MSRYQPTNQSACDPRFAPLSMYQFAYPSFQQQQQQQAYGGYTQNRAYPAFEGYPQSFGGFKPTNNVDPWFNQYQQHSSNSPFVKHEATAPDNSYIEFLKKIKCSWNGKSWMLDGKKIVISSLHNLMMASILEKGNFTEFLKMDETKAALFVKNERAPAVIQAEAVKDTVIEVKDALIQAEAIIESKEVMKEAVVEAKEVMKEAVVEAKEVMKEAVVEAKDPEDVVFVSQSKKRRIDDVQKISKSFCKVLPNTAPFDPESSNDLLFQCLYIHNDDGTIHQVGFDYLVKMYKHQYNKNKMLTSLSSSASSSPSSL